MATRWWRQRWPAQADADDRDRLQRRRLPLKADVRPGGQPSWQAPASWRPQPRLCPVRLFRFLIMLVAAIVLHKRVMRAVQRAWAV